MELEVSGACAGWGDGGSPLEGQIRHQPREYYWSNGIEVPVKPESPTGLARTIKETYEWHSRLSGLHEQLGLEQQEMARLYEELAALNKRSAEEYEAMAALKEKYQRQMGEALQKAREGNEEVRYGRGAKAGANLR